MAALGTGGLPEDHEPSTSSKANDSLSETTATSRRSLRNVERAATHRVGPTVTATTRSVATRSAGAESTAKPAPRKRRLRPLANLAVMAIAGGLVATIAIPAYAFNPATTNQAKFGTTALDSLKKANSQSVSVSGAIDGPAASGDTFTATTEQQLADKKAEAERAAAAAQMEAYASSYDGPSAADYLANPPYPNFSLAQVFSVAQKYIGTPYVYGGDTPAGFDCSGYVMFVYAQFGISLPHSASAQGAMGTRISIQDAQPGDVVIMLGGAHDGFYAGNGNILDAPDVGRTISERPIWTDDYYIVRFGI